MDELLRQRDEISAKLDIESCLITPRTVLETIATGEAKPSELLLKWQWLRVQCSSLPRCWNAVELFVDAP